MLSASFSESVIGSATTGIRLQLGWEGDTNPLPEEDLWEVTRLGANFSPELRANSCTAKGILSLTKGDKPERASGKGDSPENLLPAAVSAGPATVTGALISLPSETETGSG